MLFDLLKTSTVLFNHFEGVGVKIRQKKSFEPSSSLEQCIEHSHTVTCQKRVGKGQNQSRKLIFWSWKSGEVEGSLAEVGGEESKDDDEEKKEGNSVNHLLF